MPIMSYLVLARKYRPASFEEMEGQVHVLQALINALENERLHHAYLFTGTRGVGKTTIARILAKCLNCETGVTATPCGSCNACTEIAEGRSVDLIEVDAASRTGVDDMRELLENVQYMPTSSRFKVYLIDEVHMLSKSSFNAMLKTLEEPPEHVKFLFATTDPKKLPITVLSRCLQFNLKNLTPEQIVKYLGQVLDAESISWEEAALWQLGHAADGSMRDALSLTDQAISFGDNAVKERETAAMLGAIDQREIFKLLTAIIDEDGAAVLEQVAEMAEFAPDYAGMLDDLLAILHRLAIARSVPSALDNSQGDKAMVEQLAEQIAPEHIQLLYQIGLVGQRDLQYAPSARTGFEMVLLRMLSFALGPEPQAKSATKPDAAKPDTVKPNATKPDAAKPDATKTNAASTVKSAMSGKSSDQAIATDDSTSLNGSTEAEQASATQPAATQDESADAEQAAATQPVATQDESADAEQAAATQPAATQDESADAEQAAATQPAATQDESADAEQAPATEAAATLSLTAANWGAILKQLDLSGLPLQLASRCNLQSVDNGLCLLLLDQSHAVLLSTNSEKQLAEVLARQYLQVKRVSVKLSEITEDTPADVNDRHRQEQHAKAIRFVEQDADVQQLIKQFDGKLDRNSISQQAHPGAVS